MITAITNSSLESSTVPDAFKQAVVWPVLKRSCLMKTLYAATFQFWTCHFCQSLLKKWLQDNWTFISTWTYRHGHATETTVLRVKNDIAATLDEKGKVRLYLWCSICPVHSTQSIMKSWWIDCNTRSALQTQHFHWSIRTSLNVTRESPWTAQHQLIVSWNVACCKGQYLDQFYTAYTRDPSVKSLHDMAYKYLLCRRPPNLHAK